MLAAYVLDGLSPVVKQVADELLRLHAVPNKEVTDAYHIATAAVCGVEVLLTWNCRHMANPVTLPKTGAIVAKMGFNCPFIVTPEEFLKHKEEFDYGQ